IPKRLGFYAYGPFAIALVTSDSFSLRLIIRLPRFYRNGQLSRSTTDGTLDSLRTRLWHQGLWLPSALSCFGRHACLERSRPMVGIEDSECSLYWAGSIPVEEQLEEDTPSVGRP